MQTFLPYPSFVESITVLDTQRLNKQRVEALQILRALAGWTPGWKNHPAVRMWRGHERALIRYGEIACLHWRTRGYRDSCLDKIRAMRPVFEKRTAAPPPWLGDERVHASHRAMLAAKRPDYYPADWKNGHPAEYVWPV